MRFKYSKFFNFGPKNCYIFMWGGGGGEYSIISGYGPPFVSKGKNCYILKLNHFKPYIIERSVCLLFEYIKILVVSYLDKKRHNVFSWKSVMASLSGWLSVYKKGERCGVIFYVGGGKYSIISWYGPPFVSKGQKLLYFYIRQNQES